MSIISINNFIHEKLKEKGSEEISAIEMANLLDEAGILKDSKERPGLPLRNYLRAGRIEGGYQYPNRRWVIRSVKREKKLTIKQAADKLNITEQALYKRINRGMILTEKNGDAIGIAMSIIEKEKKKNRENIAPKSNDKIEDISKKVENKIKSIYNHIEKLMGEIKTLEKLIKTTKSKEESS